MYEALTAYISKFSKIRFGTRMIWEDYETFFDGTPPFWEDLYRFLDTHPELKIMDYRAFLEKKHIKFEYDSMNNADVSTLDGKTVLTLIVAASRAEHLCEGALQKFIRAGCIKRWLMRLKAIDEENAKSRKVNRRRKKQDLSR